MSGHTPLSPEARAKMDRAAPLMLEALRRIETAFERFESPEEVRSYVKQWCFIAIRSATS